MQQTRTPFQHEALLYEGTEEFLSRAVPFLQEGIDRGEPALVAVTPEKLAPLQDALGDRAGAVQFADMYELGANPGRIIPAWADFLAAHAGAEGVRGIGEPIWAQRRPAELVECQLHEALLNVAFENADGFRLVCPYDTAALEPGVIHEACCSHPYVVDDEGHHESRRYRRGEELLSPFEMPLPAPRAVAELLAFDDAMLASVRHAVAAHAAEAGLPDSRREDLVLAASEVAANSLRHGGGRGLLRLWREADELLCEIRDAGRISDPLAGRRRPDLDQLGGWGLWLAHRVCDLVQVRSDADGTVVRLLMRTA